MTIYAAGIVCWREENGKLEVALVHREVYKDWGFPKGKLDPGEQLPQTAVREVFEEAGFKVPFKPGFKLVLKIYPSKPPLKKPLTEGTLKASKLLRN